MKYCTQYYKNFRYNTNLDEVILNYATYRDSIIDEIDKWNGDQRIIVDICLGGDIEIIPTLQMCMKKHKEFVIRLDIIQEDMVEKLREVNIPFFYANYAKTLDEVYGMVQRRVSDIYITENLAFNIEKIGTYCKYKKVNVRVIPNIAQYRVGFRKEIPDPYKFFIRPEDTDLYEAYVDVFEIVAPNDRLSVIYEIYRNKVWDGDLSQLIVGLDNSFPNAGMIPLFGPKRLNCRQECLLENCSLCKQAKELAEKFVENKLEVIKEKDKEWNHETRSYQEAVRIIENASSNDNVEVSEEQGIQKDNK